MNCPKCGNAGAPGAAFCNVCGTSFAAPPMGTPVGAPMGGYMPPPMMMMQQRTSGMAIAGFICSFFCSVLGLIFSIMGHNEVKRSNGTVGGGGLAMAGIIISIVGLAIGVIYMILIMVVLSDASHHSHYNSY